MKKLICTLTVLISIALISCNIDRKKPVSTNVAFTNYVQAFTSGLVSSHSVITVHLAQPVPKEYKSDNLFHFSPKIAGETVLVGDRMFEFRPFEPMIAGKVYEGSFKLGEIFNVSGELDEMPFQFSVVEQSFTVELEGLSNYQGMQAKQMQLIGSVLTADIAEDNLVEKIITATYRGEDLPVLWMHDSNGRKHSFTIDSISRMPEEQGKVTIWWDGQALNIPIKDSESVEVPALNVFKILDTKVIQKPSQHIKIRFSDPLLKNQNLKGLIELEGTSDLRLESDGNEIKVWMNQRISGEQQLKVFEGIKSSNYARLKKSENFLLSFSSAEPKVRLIGKGVIAPQNDRLDFPFEAINLKAIDVRVIKVFKHNITYFFQENKLDGNSNLKRVGRLVYEGKIDLVAQKQINYNQWNTFKIDLASLLSIEQGAIYRVELRFKKEYSLYDCGGDSEKQIVQNEHKESYKTSWDSPGWYSSYYYPEGYSWKERNNPCHVSYYSSDRFVSRNIFASELGIIAKESKDRKMLFVVTNLISTQPEAGVSLKLYNYQNQFIEEIQTNSEGFAEVNLQKKPFLLIAEKQNQFGYLRLDDGTALSLSNFNVSGQEITEGIKGFIYGERNIWRPGDKLFLNFILETNSSTNEDYPIEFNLINAKNQLVERRVVTTNENGIYSLIAQTSKDAPTGNWRAEVKVGNSIFSKRLKIETIKANRLKVDLAFPANKMLDQNNRSLPIKAEWLHGSPAKHLKAKVEVLFTKNQTQFVNYQNFTFTNPASRFSQEEQTIFEAPLNEQGKGTIPLNLKRLNNAPGMLNAWFTSRIFEQGGDFSTTVTKAIYSPFQTYVGVKMPNSDDNWYKTDTDYFPEIVVLNKDGNPVSGNELEAKLYKIDWRWWWESGSENLAHYVSGSYYKPLASWQLNSSKYKSKIKLNVKYRNWEDNGRYFLWVKNKTSGHAAGITFYMSKWGSWQSEGMAEGATMLTIRTDKEKYNVGEDVEVLIPSSKAGKALVSIENGTEVLDMFWVETTDKQTNFSICTKAEMAPNFYVNVSLIQPYGNTENDAPLRMYGVIPVEVENKETILKPQIKVPKEIEPETKYTIEIKEENNKKMTYTLAIVDEGLLGLTNFKVPNPHNAFYQREALGVKTWDLYDYVAGAYGARLEKAFALGGDDEIIEQGKKEASRFKPVVQFAGPFTLKAGAKQNHEFTMPNYVGSVRVMVVAANKGAYGAKETSVPVRKGLMLLATVPRVLAPLETFELPVNVFAMKENVKNVSVTVKTNKLLKLIGSSENKLQFSEKGEQICFFKLKVNAANGIGKVYVEAKSGKEKAVYEVEVDVSNPNVPVVVQQTKLVQANENWEGELQCPGEPISQQAWAEISGFPPLNLSKHLNYLIQYPHGCLEQITSSAFPQLYLAALTNISTNHKLEIETHIRKALDNLKRYQLSNGGFAYWPGSNSVNEWGTNYAGHFMLSAENAGYTLPFGLKENWLRYQRSSARNWRKSAQSITRVYDFTQAYRLYTLALAGKPDVGAMNRLREKSAKSATVSWRLACAYVLSGKKEVAQQLVEGLSQQIEQYNELGGTFGSTLRDKAMLLETLVLLGEKENAFEVLQAISAEMNKHSWLSTQTASWCLLAAAHFSEKYYSLSDNETKFKLAANGEKIKQRTENPVVTIPIKLAKNGKVTFNYQNKGENATFVRFLAKGIPAGIDSSSSSDNLILNLNYFDTEGKTLNPNSIKQGADFVMEVRIKHPGKQLAYKQLVLSALFPSGWEILNKRIGDSSFKGEGYDYQDVRDSRVYTYFNLGVAQQKTFVFHLHAAYKGEFYHPPISCMAMYDNRINAHSTGKMIRVE